jgi:hypothetical protein
MRILGSAAADKQEALLLLLSEILTTGAAAGRASDQLKRSNVVAPPTVGVAPLLLLGVTPFATEDMITASTCSCLFFSLSLLFCSLYVSFSVLFFSLLFSSLLLEKCVSESRSQENAFDNVLLQGQGKCGFLSLPWGDHFFNSGYLWNHKLYSLLPIFKCGKKRDPQQQKQEKNSVPEMEPKQLAYFSAQDSRQHNNNNNNNKRSARNGNCSKAKANRRQAQCVLPLDIPH